MVITNDKQQINHKKLTDENGFQENGQNEESSLVKDKHSNELKSSNDQNFGPNFIILPINNQIKELQTVIRDK